ncbi:MAG TPA: MFS transporter, partial [Devosia sp.]
APVGSALFEGFGFFAIGIGTMLIPVLVLVAIVPLRPAAPEPQGERALFAVARAVWLPGLGLAFASLGFGAIASFAVLLFVERGWEPAWLSFTSFAVFFLAARLLLGHLADQIGGARVAILFAGVEALGLALIWLSPWPALGFLGAGLVGCGYSLVYPALGLESVRRAPPQSRGLAIGVYTAFLDVALGVLSPLLGILATGAGLGSVFLASAVIVALAIPVAWRLMAR